MNVLLIAIIVILLVIFTFQINKKEYYKLKRNLEFAMSLPGASIFSSLINTMQIACNHEELISYVEAITKKYGNLTRLILGTHVYVVLAKPEDYRLVLGNENGTNKSTVTKSWELFVGDGIIRTSDTTHRLRRKILQTPLNIKHLSEYVTFFDKYSNHCADTLEKNVDGPMFDFEPYLARYTFNIFLATTVGIQGTAHYGEYDELVHSLEKLREEVHNISIKPWLQLKWILFGHGKQIRVAQKIMLNFIKNISPKKVAEHTILQYNKEIFQKSKPIFDIYLNCLEQRCDDISNKSCELSDENLLDDLRTFCGVIQSNLKEMAYFVLLMLGMHIQVQDKLRQEILDTFDNDKIDAQRLLTMPYFHMVFQETLRLFPVIPLVSRQLTGDIKLESCTLPDGCYVMIPILAIHRNPAYWHKPLEFIPERFSPENSSNRPRNTYIPFSTGLRDCLGKKFALLGVGTLIVNLVRRFRFVTTSSIDDLKLTTDVILRTRDAKLSISRV